MLKSVVFFTCGGLFTGIYANVVQKYPIFYSKVAFLSEKPMPVTILEPLKVAIATAVGAAIGYGVHTYEVRMDEQLQEMIAAGRASVGGR